MENIKSKIEEYTKLFIDLYFKSESYDSIYSYLDKNITGFGVQEDELFNNKKDIEKLFELKQQFFKENASLFNQFTKVVDISDNFFVVYGEFYIKSDGKAQSCTLYTHIRFTFLIKYENEKFSIYHFHCSIPSIKGSVVNCENLKATRENNKILKDVIQQKIEEIEKLNSEFLASETRYKFAMEASNDFVFEMDLEKNITKGNLEKFEEVFEIPMKHNDVEGMFQDICLASYPDDIDRLKEVYNIDKIKEAVKCGERVTTLEYRVKNSKNGYIWVSGTMVYILNKYNEVIKIIGNIKIIDEKKRKEILTQNMALNDSLTGLYNKINTEILIKNYIKNNNDKGKFSAFMIIDIDDFKMVNDTLGHLLGDAVLRDIAHKIKGLCRSCDIIGRIGGDEFVVFLKGLTNMKLIEERAKKLINVFRECFLQQKVNYKISGSIGISIYPTDSNDYFKLFESADKALYYAKIKGKDQYQFYNNDLKLSRYINTSKARIESRHSEIAENNIINYVFQILYETPDLYNAIPMILSIVGKKFDVSRAYVFEKTSDGVYLKNTFEWCNESIEGRNIEPIKYSELKNYCENFDYNGVFYCKNTSDLPNNFKEMFVSRGVYSLIQVAIVEDGDFKGFVGFDECNGSRFWTSQEIEILTLLSKILTVFLLKKRNQDRIMNLQQHTQNVLDNLKALIYVVDPKTYKLLFLNKTALNVLNQVKINDICYKALFGYDKPCDICPMKFTNNNKDEYTMDIFNSKFNIWINVSSTKIDWDNNKKVFLIYCIDITRYKS